MGLRYLFILLAIAAIFLLVRTLKGPKKTLHRKQAGKQEPFVQCARCGLHIPRSEAIWDDTTPYCSEAHKAGEFDQ